MVQWMNLHWNDSLVNWMRLPLLCEKSGVILLMLVGLTTASRLAVKRNTDTVCIRSWNLTRVQCVTNAFQSLVWVKYVVRHVMEARKG